MRPYPKLSDAGLDVSGLTRDEVTELSRSCPHCHGGGHAVVYDPDYTGIRYIAVTTSDGRVTRRTTQTVAYCVCPAGRWVMIRQQKTCPDMYRRTHDLHDVLAGRTRWLTKDPRPMPPDDPRDLNNPPHWRELVRRYAAFIHVTPAEPMR